MDRKYALIHGNVFTGDKETLLKDHSIFIEGDQIKKIAPSTDVVRGIYDVVDLAGKFVIPGLINISVKGLDDKMQPTLSGTLPGRRIAKARKERYIKKAMYSGITTIEEVDIEEKDSLDSKVIVSTILDKLYADELSKDKNNSHLKNLLLQMEEATNSGLQVGIGTVSDCPVVTFNSLIWEMKCYAQNMKADNSLVLRMATSINASIINRENEIGSLKKGKLANIVVLLENPLENLMALNSIDRIFCNGNMFVKPYVRPDKKIEERILGLINK